MGSILSNLSDKEVALLVALAGAVGAIAVLLLRGAGFLLWRWWTGEGVHQHVAHLSSLADLRAKMQAHGMTVLDIKELEASLKSTDELSKVVEAAAPIEPDEDDNLPQRYWTTVAMSRRAGARLALVDAQLEEVLADLETLIGHREAEALTKAHRAWLVYRQREMRLAASRYYGGTMAPLVAVAHAISLTERHIEEMREVVKERKQFEG